MNLYSSSSNCGNCGKHLKKIVVIGNYKKLTSGKKNINVDLFESI